VPQASFSSALPIAGPHPGPELLVANMKMGRIVIVEEHPHRDPEKLGKRRK